MVHGAVRFVDGGTVENVGALDPTSTIQALAPGSATDPTAKKRTP